MTRRNSRRHERKEIPATIRVGWQDRSGIDKFGITRTFDISESGLRLEVQEPLPLRTDVTLRGEAINLQARGIVRYCTPKGHRFAVGVEFAGGYRWRPPSASPAATGS